MSDTGFKDERAAGVDASGKAQVGSSPPMTARVPPRAEPPTSFGAALAAARQARGLSQAEVAAHLRLQLRQVRAIESEDLSALPEGPYVRGFVRNYARLIDVPAEPLLESVDSRVAPTEPLGAESSGAATVSPVRLAARERASRLLVVGGAVAALLLFAVLGWWSMRPSTPERVEPVTPVTPAAPTERPPTAASPVLAPPPAPQPAQATDAAAPAASDTAAPVPVDVAPPEASKVAVGETALRFGFRGRSWVEVRQADGTVLMSQNNEAGSQQTVDGTPPFSMVIGNASKVDLEFRGQRVDLQSATSRGDVARLQLR